jgi:replication factor C subunit 3/5
MLLIDKYNPKSINDISFHHNIYTLLKILSHDKAFPNIIFYGPNGSGKKTLIKLFLEMLYGKEVNNMKLNEHDVVGCGNKVSTITIKQSDFHIVIEPNNNNFDKYLVQNIIKEYAEKNTLFLDTTKKFRIVLINDISNMSFNAQASLRRTMEIYSKKCKFIMWTCSLSKMIDPLLSRCMCIRVESPKSLQMFKYIYNIVKKENLDLKLIQYQTIINNAGGNIKEILWELEFLKINHNKNIQYDESINKIVEYMLKCDSSLILNIRTLIYNIIITNINATKIIIDIVLALCQLDEISEFNKNKIIQAGSFYEHHLVISRREIKHFESFVTFVINLLDTE